MSSDIAAPAAASGVTSNTSIDISHDVCRAAARRLMGRDPELDRDRRPLHG